MKLSESYDLNAAIKTQFLHQEFNTTVGGNPATLTFDGITSLKQAYDWLDNLVFPTIYSNWTKRVIRNNDTAISQLYGQNYVVGTQTARITLRNLKVQPFTSVTNETFYLRSPIDLDINTPTIKDIEFIDSLVLDQFVLARETDGSKFVIRKNGGYSFPFSRELSLAKYNFNVLTHPKITNIHTNVMAVQIVWGNPNIELFGISEFVISLLGSGEMYTKFNFYEFQINMYTCYNCWRRAVLEVLYVIIVLFQLKNLFQQWKVEWMRTKKWCKICKHTGKTPKEFAKAYKKLQQCPFKKCSCKCMTFIEEENNKKLDPNVLKKFQLVPFFVSCLNSIWELINRLLDSVASFIKREPANLVLTLSTVLTIISLSYLLAIIINPFRTDGIITTQPGKMTTTTLEEFEGFESLALLQRDYVTWQSINAWILALRVMFDFTFSGELSLVLEVVGEALFDITFFIFMFFIILLGFALNGYLLFGLDTFRFRNIGRAIIQNLLMIISENTSDYLTKIDYSIGLIYYFIFMVSYEFTIYL